MKVMNKALAMKYLRRLEASLEKTDELKTTDQIDELLDDVYSAVRKAIKELDKVEDKPLDASQVPMVAIV